MNATSLSSSCTLTPFPLTPFPSEKQFTYKLKMFDGSNWSYVGTLDVGQKIIAKRKDDSGAVPVDFQGIENSNAVRILDAQVSESEVRAIVGGSDPIHITQP